MASSSQAAAELTEEQPIGRGPLTGPIIREVPWDGKLTRARAHVAVVVVYRRGDHEVVWPHQRGRVRLSRQPATIYEVDLGVHRTVITADLPSRDYAGVFHASISIHWRVFDPSAVVRHRVTDIADTVTAALVRRARGIARTFSVGQVDAAEDEINDRLGGVPIDVTAPDKIQEAMRQATELNCLGAEYGLWTRVITELELDEVASAHNTRMMKLSWAIEEEEAEHRLRIIKNRNQQEITAARIAVYREIIAAGDVERFALRLASNPDDIEAITEIIREDQLTSRRDTIEFISHMVDSGIIERWEVSDQVREALEWLREATARVVTDKGHLGNEANEAWRQRRRGRGEPTIEGPGKEPADVIMGVAETVKAERAPAADGFGSQTSGQQPPN